MKLPTKIPGDYAEVLGIHPTQICHVNAGRRILTIRQARIILENVKKDPRLAGLNILNLLPTHTPLVPHWETFLKGKKHHGE